MNYLAHIYLSGNDEKILIGNFIGDFVKGRNYAQFYPKKVALGIRLHRKIDSYTDQHPSVLKSIRRLRETAGKLAGVAVDILYDHMLATEWKNYSEITLADFAKSTYKTLSLNQKLLPPRVIMFLPNMISNNWLVNYSSEDGLVRSLESISNRLKIKGVDLTKVPEVFLANKAEFTKDFESFFPEVISMANSEIERG